MIQIVLFFHSKEKKYFILPILTMLVILAQMEGKKCFPRLLIVPENQNYISEYEFYRIESSHILKYETFNFSECAKSKLDYTPI